MFQVGYSRIDITPTESVPLAGYGMTAKRMSTNVLDPLYSTCTALTDENGTTVLLFHNDLISSPAFIVRTIREAVSSATGVPCDHIMVCATHTHSGPDTTNSSVPSIPRYNAALPGKLAQCALEALADRKPAKAFAGKTSTNRLNFVRHYILEDGHYMGDNFGSQYDSPIVGHVTEADPEMRLIKFVREGGKDVLMVNWQVHPLTTGGSTKPDVSADLVGSFRAEMEAALDCHFTYFTGGAGNISHYSKIKGEAAARGCSGYGEALKNHAITAQFEELPLGPIKVLFNDYKEPVNRPDESLVAVAEKVMDFWKNTDDKLAVVRYAVESGFSSQYAAAHLLNRYRMESDTVDLPLFAISFGGFCFATTPCEMFDTTIKYIRDFSPFGMTFVSTCANGATPYLPSAYGFILGCYEAAMSHCRPGTAERVAGQILNMLHSIKE